jgi:DNA-binding MarR family transcriptional regulator
MEKNLKKLKPLTEVLNEQHEDLRIRNTDNVLIMYGLVHRLFDVGYRKTGLNRTQVMILSYMLSNGGSATPSELINKVDRSDNAICKSLDTLDALGLTESNQSKTDRRFRSVSLTEKGLNKVEEILPIRRRLFRKVMSTLTREEQEQLDPILSKLIDYLLQITEKKRKKKDKKVYF